MFKVTVLRSIEWKIWSLSFPRKYQIWSSHISHTNTLAFIRDVFALIKTKTSIHRKQVPHHTGRNIHHCRLTFIKEVFSKKKMLHPGSKCHTILESDKLKTMSVGMYFQPPNYFVKESSVNVPLRADSVCHLSLKRKTFTFTCSNYQDTVTTTTLSNDDITTTTSSENAAPVTTTTTTNNDPAVTTTSAATTTTTTEALVRPLFSKRFYIDTL